MTAATSGRIALELQADCFAGAWVTTPTRRRRGGSLDRAGELDEALNAAAAVGDDRIQQPDAGPGRPGSFTHGSSEQREQWFRRGYQTGDPNKCNTFDEL